MAERSFASLIDTHTVSCERGESYRQLTARARPIACAPVPVSTAFSSFCHPHSEALAAISDAGSRCLHFPKSGNIADTIERDTVPAPRLAQQCKPPSFAVRINSYIPTAYISYRGEGIAKPITAEHSALKQAKQFSDPFYAEKTYESVVDRVIRVGMSRLRSQVSLQY